MTDWPVKTLDALCDEGVVLLGRGNIISKKDIAANPGPYPIYSSARENEGKFGEYGAYMFNEEMITWSIDGGGRLFYRSKHKFSVTNVGGTLRVLKPDVLEIRYLHRALENLHSRKVFDWVFKAHPSVIRKVYDEIPIPPLEEQKRIVELLDAATARVTELTACYEQARTHANNLFTSSLRDALESNTDWPVKTLGEVCDLVGGGTPSKDRPEFYGGEIPWATVRDLNVEVLRSTEHSITAEAVKSSSSNIIPSGSVVIATRVGLGKAVIVAQDTAINQDLRGLVVKKPKELLAEYLYWWYLSNVHLVVAAGTGATVQGVKLPFISGLAIPVPPLEEQKKTVERLDSMRAKTSEMVAAYDAKLTAAKNLRQSILEAAFAGDL